MLWLLGLWLLGLWLLGLWEPEQKTDAAKRATI